VNGLQQITQRKEADLININTAAFIWAYQQGMGVCGLW